MELYRDFQGISSTHGTRMSGDESRTKGKLFEQQVAKFMTKRGWATILGRSFKGRIAVRQHDCDIFAEKLNVGWGFVAISCLLFIIAGIAYWTGLLSRFQNGWLRELNLLAPTSLLFLRIAAKKSVSYVWVECKNLRQSIKRDLIMKLKDQFNDARKPRGSWECWLVSTSRFDEDAIAHAKAHNVTCYRVIESGGRNMALHRVDSKTGDV
jgi:hypothetical protein